MEKVILRVGEMFIYDIHYKNGILELIEFTSDIKYAVKYDKYNYRVNDVVLTLVNNLGVKVEIEDYYEE